MQSGIKLRKKTFTSLSVKSKPNGEGGRRRRYGKFFKFYHFQIRRASLRNRDERDFGLETETETRVVSRPVSSFETTCQKSQYQSQNLRLISKVSVSVSNFETTMQKSQSQSQNAMDGLAHHRFWDPQRKLILHQVFINFYVRMCVQGHMKLFFLLQS